MSMHSSKTPPVHGSPGGAAAVAAASPTAIRWFCISAVLDRPPRRYWTKWHSATVWSLESRPDFFGKSDTLNRIGLAGGNGTPPRRGLDLRKSRPEKIGAAA